MIKLDNETRSYLKQLISEKVYAKEVRYDTLGRMINQDGFRIIPETPGAWMPRISKPEKTRNKLVPY